MQRQPTFPDEARFLSHLVRFANDGGDGSMLSVSGGRSAFIELIKNKRNYLQLAGPPLPPHLFWHAVGNAALPDAQQLSEAQIEQLRQLGFVYPCSPHPAYNFYHTGFVQIIEHWDSATLVRIAHLSYSALHLIYRCPVNSPLRISLEIH